VLSRLIAEGQTEEAGRYLADLGELASGLSWQAQTGNAAVDALLGSKLSAARQKGIQVFCDVKIPKHSNVKDLDWCILLSNGLDNSIKACENLDEESRYLKVETRKKGNFYLILMENKCDRELKRVPEDGTGLSNIRAVMEKYHGRVENEVSEGLYRLKLLFVDP
jgi:sensor histidine kinase YesM